MTANSLFVTLLVVNTALIGLIYFDGNSNKNASWSSSLVAKNVPGQLKGSTTTTSKPAIKLPEDFKTKGLKYEKRVKAIAECLPIFKGFSNYSKKSKKTIVLDKQLMENMPRHMSLFKEKSNMVDMDYSKKVYHEMIKNDWNRFNPIAKLNYYKIKPSILMYNDDPVQVASFKTPNMGIFNDPNYCQVHDNFILSNPAVALEKMYFFSDYHQLSIPRYFGLGEYGFDTRPKLSKNMKWVNWNQRQFAMDPRTSIFYTKKADFHNFHAMGKNFACWGQSYNHIPGHGFLIRKDLMVVSTNNYIKKWNRFGKEAEYIQNGEKRVESSALPIGATAADVKKCFDTSSTFPASFRLHQKQECMNFFNIINSETYQELKKESEVQYVLKTGYGETLGAGIFLIDNETEEKLKSSYSNGNNCGQMDDNRVVQKYIYDPLTIDGGHKFDVRIYVMVASVDPLIVYYHDGFLRVSLHKYDKYELSKEAHFTNSDLDKHIFKKLEEKGSTHMHMDSKQLKEFKFRTLETFSEYLYKNNLVSDKNWVENKLKNDFKKASIHLFKASQKNLYKNPGVFEVFGLDFVLDSQMNSFLVDVNASPEQIGTTQKQQIILKSMNKGIVSITLAYLRSRVKRSIDFLKANSEVIDSSSEKELRESISKEFQKLNKNYLEPEYEDMTQNTGWEIVVDENKIGADAYFGLVEEQCIAMMNSN